MKTSRHLLVGLLLVFAAVRLARPEGTTLPERLANDEFWALSTELSEPGGSFRSDNLLSNERLLQHVLPGISRTFKPGSAYLGVGPEQNFTYIAALEPAVAFIVDIRRGNLQLHLMYKALFELSADRVEFVSRLFSRPRPAGLPEHPAVDDLFRALLAGDASATLFAENLAAIRQVLTVSRRLPLTTEDLDGIERIYRTFFTRGPLIQYSANFGGMANFPTYAELMAATDGTGTARSYLASERAFTVVKGLHARNMIVPVVGDFAGPRALRAVGRYLQQRQAVVGAFYLSNVEQYLTRDGRWPIFCDNVAALPLDEASSFIRAIRDSTHLVGMGLTSVTGNILLETRTCVR